MQAPTLLIIGRPNVGKSTLFNFWVGHRLAIESKIPGTTRDFLEQEIQIQNTKILLKDTAGLDQATDDILLQAAFTQVQPQIQSADLILFLVSAKDGLNPQDTQVASLLRKSKTPVLLAAAQADNKNRQNIAQSDFHSLGFDTPLPFSVKQNSGMSALETTILTKLPKKSPSKPSKKPHVIILHGQSSKEKPDRKAPQNEDHWLLWLKTELEKHNFKVDNPLVPNEWEKGFADWETEINKLTITPDTILIGHSAGAAFWIKWLQKHQKPVKALFLIAPAKVSDSKDAKTPAHLDLCTFNFDPILPSLIKNGTTIFVSDTELPRRLKTIPEFEKALKTKAITFPNRGHFTLKGSPKNKKNPELLDAILQVQKPKTSSAIRLALIGRPNVGKSSLTNQLLKEERALVSDIPGTTRDLLELPFTHKNQAFTLIDTAGLRRPGKRKSSLEFFSVDRTKKAIDHADVVGLVLDSHEGVTKPDFALAKQVLDSGRALFFIANKWDLLEPDQKELLQTQLPDALQIFAHAPIITTSAETGLRTTQILDIASELHSRLHTHVKTSHLNTLFKNTAEILFMAQKNTNPPLFDVSIRGSKIPHFSFKRRIENQLRDKLPLAGIPIKWVWTPKAKWTKFAKKVKKT